VAERRSSDRPPAGSPDRFPSSVPGDVQLLRVQASDDDSRFDERNLCSARVRQELGRTSEAGKLGTAPLEDRALEDLLDLVGALRCHGFSIPQ